MMLCSPFLFRRLDERGFGGRVPDRRGPERWLTPVIASALLLWTGATWPILLYLIVVAVVTLTATFAAPETSRQPLA
jgi:hypothetical protein